ncbi:hypothetical protein D3C81_1108560 [compost metagenome]
MKVNSFVSEDRKLKFELGRCLLYERLVECGMTIDDLAQTLLYKNERLSDYIENKRIMPLKAAISIADTLGCTASDLYELIPIESTRE